MFGLENISFDMAFFLPIFMLIFATLLAYYEKITIPIAVFSIIISTGIALAFSSMHAIILTPMVNALWYGYSWTYPNYLPILALAYVVSLFLLSGMAVYNLIRTHGKSLWL